MYKWRYIIGIATLVILAALHLVIGVAVRAIVDKIATHTLTTGDLWYWSSIVVGVGIASYGLMFLWRVMLFGAGNLLGKILRDRLYEQFTRMSPQFFHKSRTGDLMAHSTNDIQAVVTTAGEGVLTLIDPLVTGIMVIGMMLTYIDWRLTVVALLPMPLMAWITSKYGTLIHIRFDQAQEAFSTMNDKVQENIMGTRVVKAFGQEKDENKEFATILDDVVEKNIAVAKVDALFDPTIILIVNIAFLISMAYGSYLVIHHEITIGALIQFSIYLGMLIWPMLGFGWLFNIVERGSASYDRVNILLKREPAVQEKEDALEVVPSGDVEYRVEKFHYPETEAVALQDIRVRICRGETLGIVGKTGSGKTTFFRLLMREFDATPGSITIGSTPITDYKLWSLREAIGYIPQEHVLFSATIAGNIAFGRTDASQEEIEAAAKAACIHEDIMQFEEGYETLVGERGVTLSGGQRQRISIARALLLNPEILLIDDALSAVDAKTEHAILESLRKNRNNKTTMISAHRLSAVEQADHIIVLEEGRIVERGNHYELLQQNGWYKEMYERQQLESLVMEGGGTVGH